MSQCFSGPVSLSAQASFSDGHMAEQLEWGEGLEIAQLVENLPFRCKATSLVSAPSHIKHGIPALLFEVPEAKTK